MNLIIFENIQKELMHLDSIIKLQNELKSKGNDETILKFIFIDDKDKLEMGVFVEMYNDLVGKNICDCFISSKDNKLLYNAEKVILREKDVKEIDIDSVEEGISKVLDIYKKNGEIDNTSIISANKKIYTSLKSKLDIDVNYKNYDKNIYDLIFEMN